MKSATTDRPDVGEMYVNGIKLNDVASCRRKNAKDGRYIEM